MGDLAAAQPYCEQALAICEARLGALDKLVKEMRDKLNMLTAKKQENNQLKAKVDSIELLADNLRNRVEEARVLMLRNESDFDIIERARPPDEAEPSGRKTLAILGVILGGGLGLMIALLQEFLDKRVRTRREAQDLGEGKLNRDVTDGWISMIQHYFLAAAVPPRGEQQHFYGKRLPDGRAVIGAYTPARAVAPGSTATFTGVPSRVTKDRMPPSCGRATSPTTCTPQRWNSGASTRRPWALSWLPAITITWAPVAAMPSRVS